MPTKPSYYELLRDPRWQRKRLEVMNRAGFKCERCADDKRTLNVHHRYYRDSVLPWDYPEDCYECLCEPCHEKGHGIVRPKRQSPSEHAFPKDRDSIDILEKQILQILLLQPSLLDDKELRMQVAMIPFRHTGLARIREEIYVSYDKECVDYIDAIRILLLDRPDLWNTVGELIEIGSHCDHEKREYFLLKAVEVHAKRLAEKKREPLINCLKLCSDDDRALEILKQIQRDDYMEKRNA